MPNIRVVEQAPAMRRLLSGLQGGVARDLVRRGVKVQNAAKLNATGRTVAGASNPEGRGPRVDTGRLRSSIGIDLREENGQPVVRIGTNVEYGRYLELGLRNGATYPFLRPALPAARD